MIREIMLKFSLVFWSVPRRLHAAVYPPVLKTRGFVAEVLLAAGATWAFTPLTVIACDFFNTGGTVVSGFGGEKPTPNFGLVHYAGFPPWAVLTCYVVVSALIMLDLFVGARAFIHLALMAKEQLKENRQE